MHDTKVSIQAMYYDGMPDAQGKYTIRYPVMDPINGRVTVDEQSLSIAQFQRVLTMEIDTLKLRMDKLEYESKNQKKWYQFWK